MMADKCVVCGEKDEGKPLYKKLGSGEYNVEVIVALRILELSSLPDSAKNDHYICWDCDETIVAEYGRFLESEEKRQIKVDEEKGKRKRKRAEQREKKKQEEKLLEEKPKTDRAEKRKSDKVEKPKDNIIRITTDTTNGTHAVSKTKKLEIVRAKNAYNMNHCLLCDNTFDSSVRGYQRFSLKKIVTDEMDIASVIEQLGLARHIAPEMKSKRFVCANCYYTIRRNYKDKIEKGSSLGEAPVDAKNIARKGSFHRATPDEHAAEIAKLLPPALAECYKIMTSESFDSNKDNKEPVENAVDQKAEGDIEEEEEGLCVSQDELGNYVVNMNLRSPPKVSTNQTEAGSNGKEGAGQPTESPCTPRKKKNILLPKRHHHHLVDGSSSQTGGISSLHKGGEGTGEKSGSSGELDDARTCNICGHTVVGKPADWWHTLSSPLSAFETITVSMALQLLETSLASTSEKARLASQVCLPCYGMVSTGFRLQIVQRIARQKNIDPSKVNLSKVKFHMMKKDDKLLTNTKEESFSGGKHANNDENKVVENAAVENKDMNGPNCVRENSSFNEMGTQSGVKRFKRKNYANEEKKVKKLKVSDIIKASSVDKKKGDDSVGNSASKNCLSKSDSDDAFNVSGEGDHSPVNDSSYFMSSDSDFEIKPRKRKVNKKTKRRKLSRQTPVKASKNNHKIKPVSESRSDKDLSVGKSITANNNMSQKEVSGVKGMPDVTGSGCSDEVKDKKQSALYEVDHSCTLYFAISKMKKASVVLRDIGEILPKEAFDGRTLTARLTANSSYLISLSDDSPTPLQYILNSLATPSHFINASIPTSDDDSETDSVISGCCVVCATKCHERKFFWHKLEECINPPSIQVPVRWVCASLSIAPVAVSESDRAKGLVCRTCFVNLSNEFDVFVRTKIGESCDIPPGEVEIGDYIVTFNQDTMNIEADPVDMTPEEEIEESEKILSKIMPVIQSIGLDDLVGACSRVPLETYEYTIWLLLVLNEFRVQLGRDPHYLIHWLTRLMPVELYLEGLCPSEDRLLPFIKSLAKEWSLSSKDSFEKLNTQIPLDLFNSRDATVFSSPSKLAMEIKEEVMPSEIQQIIPASKQGNKMQWEDFLLPVDLDRLFQGTAKPLPREDFNNGLLYAFWRLQQITGGDENQLADWIKQISPITLEKKHLQLLLNAPAPIHEHLQNHPEDMDKLKCVIIPDSVQIKPKDLQNDVKPSESNQKHEKVNASSSVDANQSTNKSANWTPRVRKKRGRPRKNTPSQLTVQKEHSSQRGDTSRIGKNTSLKSQVPENHLADSKENETSVTMGLGHSAATPKAEVLGNICPDTNVKKVIQKSPDTDTSYPEEVSVRVQERKTSRVDRLSKETNATSRLKNNVKSSTGLVSASKKEVSSVTATQDKSFREKDVSADKSESQNEAKSESQDEAALLANKVKELERQLLAMKKQNEALLHINQKLSETVSSDEFEDVENIESEKTVKTNESKLVNSVIVDKCSPQKVPCSPKYSMDGIKEKLLEPVAERSENSKSLGLIKKKSNNKLPGHPQLKKSVLKPGKQVEQSNLSVAKPTNSIALSPKNEQLSKIHSSPVDRPLDSSASPDSQNELRTEAQGPLSKMTSHVLDEKHSNSTKSPGTSSGSSLSKTKQKQVKPKPRFEDFLNYDT